MNERLQTISFVEGETGVTLGDNFRYFTVPFQMTIVAVTCSPSVDDSGATIDINDDGTGVITAIDCSDQNVPGTWKSTHITGGTETPVSVAAGSVLSFDLNNGAANTRVGIVIWYLGGEVSA
jgi:hypothetical protein